MFLVLIIPNNYLIILDKFCLLYFHQQSDSPQLMLEELFYLAKMNIYGGFFFGVGDQIIPSDHCSNTLNKNPKCNITVISNEHLYQKKVKTVGSHCKALLKRQRNQEFSSYPMSYSWSQGPVHQSSHNLNHRPLNLSSAKGGTITAAAVINCSYRIIIHLA